MRRNRVYDGKQLGVFVQKGGGGVLEDNEILTNARSGVAVSEDGNPTLAVIAFRKTHIPLSVFTESGEGFSKIMTFVGISAVLGILRRTVRLM